MRFRSMVLSVGIVVSSFVTPCLAQNPGNPTVLQEIQQARQEIGELRTLIQSIVTQLGQPPADVRKLYFLTTTEAASSAAPNACGTGFHFASLWEIFDTSNLKYDTTRGATSADSGEGPPSLAAGFPNAGWIRTGGAASGTANAGRGNCQAWTSGNAGDDGTIVALPDSWSFSSDRIEPWATTTSQCNFSHRVWCIQD
jgi:hypothetical protein